MQSEISSTNSNLNMTSGRGFIMVINESGERKQVKIEDYYKSQNHEDEIIPDGFKYDLSWDISHGFTEAKNAFGLIESNTNYKVQSEEFRETGYMDLEEARQRLHARIDKLEEFSQKRKKCP